MTAPFEVALANALHRHHRRDVPANGYDYDCEGLAEVIVLDPRFRDAIADAVRGAAALSLEEEATILRRLLDDAPVPSRSRAPWTDEQIAALNARQRDWMRHPYTCEAHSNTALLATREGWTCPLPGCGYRQAWAHAADVR